MTKAAKKNATQLKQQAQDYWALAYFTMGAARSIERLRADAIAAGLKPPAASTLLRWSGQSHWVQRAKEYDARVAARAEELAVEDDAGREARQANQARELTILAYKAAKNELTPEERDAIIKAAPAWKTYFEGERTATGMATERIEIKYDFMHEVGPRIVQLFLSINMISDPEIRGEQFGAGMMELQRAFLGSD